jgi:glycosyltransferase involved in cell wall biosynthesis
MLKPVRVMLIDSRAFNGPETRQHPEWYDGFDTHVIAGFPSNMQVNRFLYGLSHVLSCELFYNYNLPILAQRRGIRTYLQPNYEFYDALLKPVPLPDKLLMPSSWHLEDMQQRFPGRVELLPPPTFHQEFKEAREKNLVRTGPRRFLHIVGKPAVHDRAGTQALLDALKHTTASFELVIKAQSPLGLEVDDHRVRFDYTSPEDQGELYKDFDALVMPRRYGGLSLPVNEALMSALPVLMTDVSPNTHLLPAEWLTPATRAGEFMTRTMIDLFDADPVALAAKLDEFCYMSDRDLQAQKARAFDIGYTNFAPDVLRPRWLEALT